VQTIRAVTTPGQEIILSDAEVTRLRDSLQGELLRAEDSGYDEGRALWNALHDRRPALIVRCAGAGDAVAAVNFARTHRIPVAVRSGGHNVGGTGSCNGGIQLDLSRMKGIHIDPDSQTASVEPGVTWGEFDRQAQEFGLATTGGTCSQTGVAGVTLGGGFGWLMRKHGLAVDNLLALEVVTADGELRRASESENPDLFFGLRGTQSNLGIVTLLEFRLHAVGPTVLAGMVLHPLARGKEVLRFYRDFTATAPEELSTWAALLSAPDGSGMAAILACHAGDPNEGERAVAPLRAFGPPVMDMLQPMPYVQAQTLFDESFPRGRYNYWKSSLLDALGDEAIDALVEGYGRVLSPYSSVLIEHLGGAVSRVRPDETAFAHRTAAYDAVIMPMWTSASESEANIGWADDLWRALQPCSSGGVYVNYLGSEGEARIEAAYGTNFARLTALKSKYDPGNLLCSNQNIKPR